MGPCNGRFQKVVGLEIKGGFATRAGKKKVKNWYKIQSCDDHKQGHHSWARFERMTSQIEQMEAINMGQEFLGKSCVQKRRCIRWKNLIGPLRPATIKIMEVELFLGWSFFCFKPNSQSKSCKLFPVSYQILSSNIWPLSTPSKPTLKTLGLYHAYQRYHSILNNLGSHFLCFFYLTTQIIVLADLITFIFKTQSLTSLPPRLVHY